MTELTSKLRVDDEDFLVASLIDRCPKSMMLRELVMNAVEAAGTTLGSKGKVWIGTTDLDGVQKLTIRNSGPGMDAEKLHRMCNIAASFGKEKGLRGNFGMGAKVASLPSNHLGLCYRSCTQGKVHEIIIGRYDGVYGRLRRKASDGTLSDIVNVTSMYAAETLASDWTEVVLFGQRPEQDTLLDPYDGDPPVPSFWIPLALYHRFYRLPQNIDIMLAEGVHWHNGDQIFQTVTGRLNSFAKSESVTTPNGIIIHYLYDPAHSVRGWENNSSEEALQSAASFAALVHNNELFDIHSGSAWAYKAPRFGITFAARHLSVHIELPPDYPALPDAYRQFLRFESGEQNHMDIDQFADLVREHRPLWLCNLLDEFGLNRRVSQKLTTELSSLRSQLGVKLYEHVERPPGWKPPNKAAAAKWVEPELDIVQLTDPNDINDRWLAGRAACYYPSTRQLFINTTYESIEALAQKAATAFGAEYPPEALAARAKEAASEAIIRRIARALLHGLAKSSQPKIWQSGHIEKAIAPEALSMIADDWHDMVYGVCAVIRHRIEEEAGESV